MILIRIINKTYSTFLIWRCPMTTNNKQTNQNNKSGNHNSDKSKDSKNNGQTKQGKSK